jgi:multiple sugar transport system permease protein
MATAAVPLPLEHRRPWWHAFRRGRWFGYIYGGPVIVAFLLFNLYPMALGLYLSFTDWNILSPPVWSGLKNYNTMLVGDPLVWQSLWQTLYYALASVTGTTVVSLLLALALNQRLRSIGIYRTFFFLPAVTSLIAIAMVWRWLYNSEYGLLNGLLNLFGVPALNWLGDDTLAMPAVIFMSVWRSAGFNTVLFLAGLQGVPQEYYEAAQIDGANGWRRFLHITVPLVSPTTFFVVVNGLIGSWQVFDQVYILTRGGPHLTTVTVVYLIYSNGFEWFKTGYAAALAYGLFLIIMAFTAVQFLLQKRWVFYS